MKKNVKLLIAIAAAAVVLVGVMLLLIFLPKSGDDADPMDSIDQGIDMSTSVDENGMHQAKINTNDKGEIENNSYGTLLEYVPAKISTIDLENTSGTMEIKSETPVDEDGKTEETKYTLVGFEDFTLQTGYPDAIANDAAALEFTKVISLDGAKASECGFDSPKATVVVTYTDNTKAKIIVGGDAPSSAGTYVKFGTSDTIYLVESDAVDSFSYSLTEMFSKAINDAAVNTDDSQYSKITLSGKNFPEAVVLEPNNDGKNSATTVITSPKKSYASEDASSNVSGAIRGLYADSVKMVNPSEAQLKELGLADPYVAIEAVYPDTTVSLIASQPDSSGNVNVMEKGGKVVYTKVSANLPWVNMSYEKLSSEYVLHPLMSAVDTLTINNGTDTYSFSISSKQTTTTNDDGEESSTTTTTVKYGDNEINLSYFSTFFQNLTLLEKSDTTSDKPSGKAVFTAEYKYTDGSTDTVKFYDAGGNKYLAEVNGESVGHLYKTNPSKLIEQVKTVANNKEVADFAA
ncbi:DUF4340 domain-containing protein [Ruminococcus sp.]|uniref:DUF4340 domain-containing protein n=1 Tax=Ruminococcus sp. TaxID=41978 RepID=UPI003866BE5A